MTTRVRYMVSVMFRDCPIPVDVKRLDTIPLGGPTIDLDVDSGGAHFTFADKADIPWVMSNFSQAFGIKSYEVCMCEEDRWGRRKYIVVGSNPILNADELYSWQSAGLL